MSIKQRSIVIATLPCLLLAGCAETTFQDTLGIGKSAPDETKVQTLQPLAVPPDLQLRPPVESSERKREAAATGRPGAALATPLASAPAHAAGNASRASGRGGAQVKNVATTTGSGDFYDIYRKYGISLYDEKGRRKSITKLNMELAEKIKQERRKKDPDYGTIFNIESLWQD